MDRGFFEGFRKQRVVLNGKYSTRQVGKRLLLGFPRDQSLGRYFSSYMPDSLNSFCKIFADDTKVYTAVEDRRGQIKLQKDLLKMSKWSKLWLLEFSIKKCKVIQYGNVHEHFEYKLIDKDGNLQTLQEDTTEKDLGIWFQNNLKFDEHINYVVNRSNKLLGLIKRTFNMFKALDKESFLILYKSLIRSIPAYGGSVYYSSSKKNYCI